VCVCVLVSASRMLSRRAFPEKVSNVNDDEDEDDEEDQQAG